MFQVAGYAKLGATQRRQQLVSVSFAELAITRMARRGAQQLVTYASLVNMQT
jgi:hypothetical protein